MRDRINKSKESATADSFDFCRKTNTISIMIAEPKKDTKMIFRGVEEMVVEEHLKKALWSGKKLRVKLGIDPTSPDIHLGHMVPLRKLRQFQELGHKVVLIIGDFTAMIGDPSGKNETRKPMTEAEVKNNLKKYTEQAGKIIDVKKTEIRRNGEWHKKEGVKSMLKLAGAASMQQVLRRADFQERLKNNADISVLEILYPLFQGYDSVKIKADVEIGGTDQKFNLLMGRKIQRFYGQPEQDVMMLPLLEGMDGTHKMSKSLGNYISLSEKPEAMFGKIMSVPDSLLEKYYLLLTDLEFPKEESPYEAKLRLAKEIVVVCHGQKASESAFANFKKVFSKKEAPADMPEVKISGDSVDIIGLLTLAGISSKSEARRLIAQGAVEIDGKKHSDPMEKIQLQKSAVLKVGKTRFFRINVDH